MIKKLFKWFFILLLIATLAIGLLVWHTFKFKPLSIDLFFNRVAIGFIGDSPETLTSLGFLEQFGIKGHQDDLDDASVAEGIKQFEKTKKELAMLRSYDDAKLSDEQKLSKDILEYLLAQGVDGEEFQYYDYPVNQLFGIQSNFPSFMDAQHQINSPRDARDYVSRLNKVKTKFEQVKEGLELRESKGILPPRFVVDRVLDEMTKFVEQPIDENILVASLKRKMDEAEFSQADKDALLESARGAMQNSVHPAYQSFIDYFTTLKPKTTTDDGYWKLPNGDQAYRLALKTFTTTDYSPDYIHNLGLREVERIQAEMLKILEGEGFDTTQVFFAAMNALAEDERFYYPDTDEGREQILADYQKIIDEINAGLDNSFNVRPASSVEVVRIPEFKEKTSPGAYYQQPSMDGSRPGRFFANLYDIKATPKYGMRTLAYHEAIPGHHFQIAIAQELEGVPIFRKFGLFTAYVEGWALYSEQVAWEQGFQSNPLDNLGRLQAELFRGVRLVVDTGIHAKRWTRQEAIDYMIQNTAMAESDVVSEIERYIVMPGQACAYKVGMIKILELREKARNALGAQFDIKEFHDVVLKNGAVPLDILEQIVDSYISESS